jgi:predicted nuclease of predicted toxin-antitoxin system
MLRLLIDEDVHIDILEGLRRRNPTIDVIRVHDVGLNQTPDADILEWAAQNDRVVVSVDKKTLAVDAWNRVGAGRAMPGVAILRTILSNGHAIQELELLAIVGNPEDLRNQVVYLPI